MLGVLGWDALRFWLPILLGIVTMIGGAIFPVVLADVAVGILALMGVWLGAAILYNPAAFPYLPEAVYKGTLVCVVLVIFGACGIFIEALKGQRLEEAWAVRVTFGDSQLLTPRKRWVIRRTVNEYYQYLKTAGLNPPTDSPLLKVGKSRQRVCSSAPGSPLNDIAAIPATGLEEKAEIASAYSHCFFQRLILNASVVGGSKDADNRLDLIGAVSEYFPLAFSAKGTPITELASALLLVRDKCGAEFTDGAVASATGHISAENGGGPSEELGKFFYRHFLGGMIEMRSAGENRKIEDASAILKAKGFAD